MYRSRVATVGLTLSVAAATLLSAGTLTVASARVAAGSAVPSGSAAGATCPSGTSAPAWAAPTATVAPPAPTVTNGAAAAGTTGAAMQAGPASTPTRIAQATPGPVWHRGAWILTAVAASPDPFAPGHHGTADTTAISYTLSRPGFVSVRVVDAADHPVRLLAMLRWQPAGTTSVVWDGRDGDGGTVPDGTYQYRVSAFALLHAPSSRTGTVRVDTTAPAAPTGLSAVNLSDETGAAVALSWNTPASDDIVAQCVYRVDDGAGAAGAPGEFQVVASLPADATSWVDHGVAGGHTYRYLLRAVDAAGLIGEPSSVATETPGPPTPGGLPPDPASVAEPLDPTVPTDLRDATAFLYTGADPIQVGVEPGTITDQRAAVLRGRVLARGGDPLAGVTVAVADHPEFGHTTSRADGGYDLAVNGGGRLVVTFAKAGYPTVQREVATAWQDYRVLADVTLVAYDTAVTAVDLGGDSQVIQIAQGSPVTDADGTRQATLLFPAGVTATATLPDGTTETLATAHVRATEFTVGDDGPAAMPGPLPASSAYTYAAEFSVDEAVAAGASTVAFSSPVIDYTQNFLHFPVGTPVPTGFYDRATHAWIAGRDGRVVSVLSVSGGVATLDVAGKGAPATAAELDALGVTAGELAEVGALYPAGTGLWRVPIDHFTPWDHNWPFSPPAGALAPALPELVADATDTCQGTVSGSVVGCDNQTLGERVGITGTGMSLAYQSERVPGRDNRTVIVPVTGGTLPPGILKVLMRTEVAGQSFVAGWDPRPNITTVASWDGNDAYGRRVQGSALLAITVGYLYPASYTAPAADGYSFGNYGAAAIEGDRTRQEIILWGDTQQVPVGGWDARGVGLGGWTLSAQQFYDPVARVLHRGDGSDSGGELGWTIQPVAGSAAVGYHGDGGPARTAALNAPQGVAVAADGTVYVADTGNVRVRAVSPDGRIQTIAGNGVPQDSGDGGPASASSLADPQAVAVTADGNVLVSTRGHRIRRIGPDGVISTIAGTGSAGWSGDGGPATAATLSSVTGIEVAPDGTVYLADSGACLIRAIAPDGTIRRVAGLLPAADANDPRCGFGGDGGKARAALLNHPTDISLRPDGSLLIADSINNRIRQVAVDGTITTVLTGNTPTTVESFPTGGYAVFDSFTVNRIRLVGTDGSVRVIAGTGLPGGAGDGGPATRAALNQVHSMAVAPGGSLLLADSGNNRIRALAVPLPGQTGDQISVVAADGSQVYLFDHGRHVRTVNAVTGATATTLAYDLAGRLATVTDGDGNITRIEHDATGTPTAIVAPGGQRTTLAVDAAGYLSAITAPGGAATRLASDPDGLLRSMTEPGGGVHTFDYTYGGYLHRDTSPDGHSTTLTRTVSGTGHTVTATTSTGRTTTLISQRLPGGVTKRSTIAPTGATMVGTVAPDGTRTITEPDGTQVRITLGPDPRFGMAAPIITAQTMTTPSGLVSTTTVAATAVLADMFDPLSARTLTSTVTTNGRTATSVYDATAHTVTVTSPEGRVRVVTLDAQGRTVGFDAGDGLAAVTVTYDGRGLRRSVDQGGRVTSYGYDDRMRVVTVTDPDGRLTRYGYDDADRLVSTTSPGGGTTSYGYDADGHVTTVTLPGGRIDRFGYDAGGRVSTIDPSGPGAWATAFDADGQPSLRTRPDAIATVLSYGDTGLLTGATEDGGSVAFGYDPTATQLSSVSVDSGAAIQTRTFAFDGPLLIGATTAGTVPASVRYTYDSDLLPIASTLTSGSDTVTLDPSYDKDLLLVAVGGFSISRNGFGSAVGMGDGTGQWTYHYDVDGRLDSQSLVVAGRAVYRIDLTWTAGGSLRHRSEQADGEDAVDYAYDADGHLTDVTRGGVVVEHYDYDVDGRRIAARSGDGPTQLLTYDDADRLTTVAGQAYTYAADGSLTGRGADVFRYGFDGQLTSATVGGASVTYTYDAAGRRLARTDAGGTTGYIYAGATSPWRVSAVREPDGQLTALLYDDQGHLASFTRGGQRYYVATDQVGSPRVVTDSGGTVVKTLGYDTFGQVLSDSAPSFSVPLGFAGGLVDPVTGLIRFGLRDYDPAVGRFTTRDPAGLAAGSTDPYGYVGNDPASHADPAGLAEDDGVDPMTQEISGDIWAYHKARLGKLYDLAVEKVKGIVASKMCLGPVCLNPEQPELSVGKDITVTTGDQDAIKVGAECTIGITPTQDLHQDSFSWKVKLAGSIPFLTRIPIVGKYFAADQTYQGGFGAVRNYYGLDNQLIKAAQVGGVAVPGVDDLGGGGAGN